MGLFSPNFHSLHDLYINELRDLYSAEVQLLAALPKMAEAASSPYLKKAFKEHLEETEGHVDRLEHIFDRLQVKPSGETCLAMKGLIKEAQEYVSASGDKDVCDAGIIGAAQRVEHYEMAGYGTARTLAQHLGETDAADLLQLTLEEEKSADKKLTELAESGINSNASAAA